MTSNIPKAFHGPFKRAELISLPQYSASDSFLSAGKWTGSKNHVLSLNVNKEGATSEALYCIVVGTVISDKAYLGKHGNFNPKFNEDAQKAKIQFTLARPDDPDFGPDYDNAVLAFEKYQDDISTTALHQFFLTKEEGHTMRMNYALFEPKGEINDKDREKDTQSYNVGHEFQTFWSIAKDTNYTCIMPVFDMNDALINCNRYADKLVGALCEVTFTLKHYSIRGHKDQNGKWTEGNDVFSAQVESVSILKNPLTIPSSPYKGRLTRKPHHRPQIPSRLEQINAANAFIPRIEHKSATGAEQQPLLSPHHHCTEDAPSNPPLPSDENNPSEVSPAMSNTTGTAASSTVNSKSVSGKKRTKGPSTSTSTLHSAEDDDHPSKKSKTG